MSDPGAAWSRIAAFVVAVDASLGKWLVDAYRVGLTDYRALVRLADASDSELRVNDLAAQIGLNQSSVTRLISRLEAKGLTRRDLCPDDARGVYAVLTDEGRALVDAVRSPYAARVSELLREVATQAPDADAGQLARDVAQISDLLTAA